MKPETRSVPPGPCPDVEALVRLMDDELDPADREALLGHLHVCPTCDDRLRTLESRSGQVSAWLARHDPPVPGDSEYDLRPPRVPGRRSRWALAASIVVAVAVAAGPARGWLLARLGFSATPTSDVHRAQHPSLSTTTAFVPYGTTVSVTFDAGVQGRTLSVTRSADTLVSLAVSPSRAEVVVGPDRLDVHDAGQSPIAYRLSVPATVSEVRVKVNGADDVIVPVGGSMRVVAIPVGGR